VGLVGRFRPKIVAARQVSTGGGCNAQSKTRSNSVSLAPVTGEVRFMAEGETGTEKGKPDSNISARPGSHPDDA